MLESVPDCPSQSFLGYCSLDHLFNSRISIAVQDSNCRMLDGKNLEYVISKSLPDALNILKIEYDGFELFYSREYRLAWDRETNLSSPY